MKVSTPMGDVELLEPEGRKLRTLRSRLPLGAVAFDAPAQGARYGIVMKCGDEEAWAVKQQSVEVPNEVATNVFVGNSILIALSIATYRDHGFGGCLIPCAYVRDKGEEKEVGFAYFGAPSESGTEVAEFPFEAAFDGQFGHGFTTMFTHFVRRIQHSSKESGIPLQPFFGLDERPRSALGSVGFGFLVHGRDIYCLKTTVSEKDPVWAALRSTGVESVYHIPSLPTEIPPDQLSMARSGEDY